MHPRGISRPEWTEVKRGPSGGALRRRNEHNFAELKMGYKKMLVVGNQETPAMRLQNALAKCACKMRLQMRTERTSDRFAKKPSGGEFEGKE